ncbi:MAG: hypothetical protein A2487_08925 [Candidatus Raymondbacteria bacterium RifOxyC12_full_50_8]|uniref:Uncharacterized protein n=1 Tax=Candidatus Raymondbacteria bacterium RIFOXYD12_FULL_49_13 TaxID=1817890 RepID=A0A1F7FIS1_UNCRA|nr:MAG: hypothetical protein A2248_21530 [Candidatus Raymondbacteria bacterium RIFOXYA2_FULL_49_16]OGJ94686.1 MAG: hypothetical protein A2350_08495 [Candidatus Raymondbacteria bacterium RifOxyB12_full_50_8]OGK04550.1 MAG: hypothetical protein A2487_08925 [Candidatus Raymondbacteria bacterium RifOxyC12_full_50_8]OGK06366.1 MAG: hypothetical protein A2519_08855 [Candidatus Raymondbacteria bacterium RIFOXYD12_FULL_49_13]OGP40700.1 MAG: hypothetical protein A2324_03600 [Candidatus Raymondbacteria b
MFETFKQGIVGLALFFGNWMGPSTGVAEIKIEHVKRIEQAYLVSCRIDLSRDSRLEQLVDAGIPLRVALVARPVPGDSISLVRTLRFDVVDYTYSFTDSSSSNTMASKKFPMLLLALKEFSQWETRLPLTTSRCTFDASVLPSAVSRLGRELDMSQIWDRQRLTITVDIRTLAEK